ncbi:MAG: pyridoxal phosphate enzyme (YggS family) [Bacteroidia bacterium]|jgi:pyridoxal phosphate enzyme (YggS family)|tara:strand:- start:91 stop:735 length:645 start_codon:yes stop_codon:yes gene_type:complete
MHNNIRKNITLIEQEIGNTQLVVVSKYRSLEELKEVYSSGHRDFGENRVQELVEKHEQLPKDIHWHVIGHLQTNKVKHIANFVHLIHSIDSLKLLKEVNKQAEKCDRIIPFLFQMHIADEETKFGLSTDTLSVILDSPEYQAMTNVKCQGLMGMATNTEDNNQVTQEFNSLKSQFEEYKALQGWDILSMGMSGDYIQAVSSGSTLVRVGSKIFN